MPEKALIANPEDIELNDSDEIQQILGNPPSWILRWGITLMFVAACVFLALSWFIKYPDVVDAPAVLTTQHPPIRVVAPSSGKITQLLVKEQQVVSEGQLLAILENAAQWNDMLALEKLVNQIDIKIKNNALLDQQLPSNWQLGTLQNSYSIFSQNWKTYQYEVKQDITLQKLNATKQQIMNLQLLNQSLTNQQQTIESEMALAQKNLTRAKTLLKDGNASISQVEQAEGTVLQYKRQLESTGTGIVTNNIQIQQLELQMLEAQRGKDNEQASKLRIIFEDLQRLKTEIQQWKQTFLVHAPIRGNVSLNKILTSKQFINAGEELLALVPTEERGAIFGRAALPNDSYGKVKIGMNVQIQLAGFPYQEFGIVPATLTNISLVPNMSTDGASNYMAELSLQDSLQLNTTYQKAIPFRQEMQGTARIVTEDRRIIDRVFDKVLNLLKNK